MINPIFGLTVSYQPFEVTTLLLNASRAISPSYYQNQITATTEISAAIHQRLLRRFILI